MVSGIFSTLESQCHLLVRQVYCSMLTELVSVAHDHRKLSSPWQSASKHQKVKDPTSHAGMAVVASSHGITPCISTDCRACRGPHSDSITLTVSGTVSVKIAIRDVPEIDSCKG